MMTLFNLVIGVLSAPFILKSNEWRWAEFFVYILVVTIFTPFLGIPLYYLGGKGTWWPW